MVICGRSRLSAAGGYWSKTGNFKHLQSSSKTFYTLYKLIYMYMCVYIYTHTYVYVCILTVRPVKSVLTPPSIGVDFSFQTLVDWFKKEARAPGTPGGPGAPGGPRGPRRPRKRVSALYILDVQHRYKSDGIWMHSLPTWHRLIERISDIAYYRHVMLDADCYPLGKASNYQWYA